MVAVPTVTKSMTVLVPPDIVLTLYVTGVTANSRGATVVILVL